MNTKPYSPVSSKVFKLFEMYKYAKFYFVEPGGNFGDFLIYQGAYKLAKLAGLNYEILKHEEFINVELSQECIVYIHGGGGFLPIWSGNSILELRKAISSHRGIVILGPTTFSDDEMYTKTILNDVFYHCQSERIYMFAREERSFIILNKFLSRDIHIYCDHDTALNLTIDDFKNKFHKSNYSLIAIREDREARGDIKSVWWTVDPIKVTRDFNGWLLLHGNAKFIITNRLHSAICGCILGVPTELLAGNYHKNRSVWEFSLIKRDVKWVNKFNVRLLTRIKDYLLVPRF